MAGAGESAKRGRVFPKNGCEGVRSGLCDASPLPTLLCHATESHLSTTGPTLYSRSSIFGDTRRVEDNDTSRVAKSLPFSNGDGIDSGFNTENEEDDREIDGNEVDRRGGDGFVSHHSGLDVQMDADVSVAANSAKMDSIVNDYSAVAKIRQRIDLFEGGEVSSDNQKSDGDVSTSYFSSLDVSPSNDISLPRLPSLFLPVALAAADDKGLSPLRSSFISSLPKLLASPKANVHLSPGPAQISSPTSLCSPSSLSCSSLKPPPSLPTSPSHPSTSTLNPVSLPSSFSVVSAMNEDTLSSNSPLKEPDENLQFSSASFSCPSFASLLQTSRHHTNHDDGGHSIYDVMSDNCHTSLSGNDVGDHVNHCLDGSSVYVTGREEVRVTCKYEGCDGDPTDRTSSSVARNTAHSNSDICVVNEESGKNISDSLVAVKTRGKRRKHIGDCGVGEIMQKKDNDQLLSNESTVGFSDRDEYTICSDEKEVRLEGEDNLWLELTHNDQDRVEDSAAFGEGGSSPSLGANVVSGDSYTHSTEVEKKLSKNEGGSAEITDQVIDLSSILSSISHQSSVTSSFSELASFHSSPSTSSLLPSSSSVSTSPTPRSNLPGGSVEDESSHLLQLLLQYRSSSSSGSGGMLSGFGGVGGVIAAANPDSRCGNDRSDTDTKISYEATTFKSTSNDASDKQDNDDVFFSTGRAKEPPIASTSLAHDSNYDASSVGYVGNRGGEKGDVNVSGPDLCEQGNRSGVEGDWDEACTSPESIKDFRQRESEDPAAAQGNIEDRTNSLRIKISTANDDIGELDKSVVAEFLKSNVGTPNNFRDDRNTLDPIRDGNIIVASPLLSCLASSLYDTPLDTAQRRVVGEFVDLRNKITGMNLPESESLAEDSNESVGVKIDEICQGASISHTDESHLSHHPGNVSVDHLHDGLTGVQTADSKNYVKKESASASDEDSVAEVVDRCDENSLVSSMMCILKRIGGQSVNKEQKRFSSCLNAGLSTTREDCPADIRIDGGDEVDSNGSSKTDYSITDRASVNLTVGGNASPTVGLKDSSLSLSSALHPLSRSCDGKLISSQRDLDTSANTRLPIPGAPSAPLSSISQSLAVPPSKSIDNFGDMCTGVVGVSGTSHILGDRTDKFHAAPCNQLSSAEHVYHRVPGHQTSQIRQHVDYTAIARRMPKVTGVIFDRFNQRWVATRQYRKRKKSVRRYFCAFKYGFEKAYELAVLCRNTVYDPSEESSDNKEKESTTDKDGTTNSTNSPSITDPTDSKALPSSIILSKNSMSSKVSISDNPSTCTSTMSQFICGSDHLPEGLMTAASGEGNIKKSSGRSDSHSALVDPHLQRGDEINSQFANSIGGNFASSMEGCRMDFSTLIGDSVDNDTKSDYKKFYDSSLLGSLGYRLNQQRQQQLLLQLLLKAQLSSPTVDHGDKGGELRMVDSVASDCGNLYLNADVWMGNSISKNFGLNCGSASHNTTLMQDSSSLIPTSTNGFVASGLHSGDCSKSSNSAVDVGSGFAVPSPSSPSVTSCSTLLQARVLQDYLTDFLSHQQQQKDANPSIRSDPNNLLDFPADVSANSVCGLLPLSQNHDAWNSVNWPLSLPSLQSPLSPTSASLFPLSSSQSLGEGVESMHQERQEEVPVRDGEKREKRRISSENIEDMPEIASLSTRVQVKMRPKKKQVVCSIDSISSSSTIASKMTPPCSPCKISEVSGLSLPLNSIASSRIPTSSVANFLGDDRFIPGAMSFSPSSSSKGAIGGSPSNSGSFISREDSEEAPFLSSFPHGGGGVEGARNCAGDQGQADDIRGVFANGEICVNDSLTDYHSLLAALSSSPTLPDAQTQ